MSEHDKRRLFALAFDYYLHNRPEELTGQGFGPVRGSSQKERRRITEPPFEFACNPRRIRQASSFRCFPDKDSSVIAKKHHGRQCRSQHAERAYLDVTVAKDGGRRHRRS